MPSNTAQIPESLPTSEQQPTPDSSSPPNQHRKVIGFYGLPGCGKSYLAKRLEDGFEGNVRGIDSLEFIEGSALIDSLVDGGLPAFKALTSDEQMRVRAQATNKVRGSNARKDLAFHCYCRRTFYVLGKQRGGRKSGLETRKIKRHIRISST